jgi:hypothetical protein
VLVLADIDWGALLEVIWVSLVAGIGVTAVYSVIIYTSSRAGDARREGNGGAAAVYGTLAALAFAMFLAGVIVGVTIMLNKG